MSHGIIFVTASRKNRIEAVAIPLAVIAENVDVSVVVMPQTVYACFSQPAG